jgi:hypothetical protein
MISAPMKFPVWSEAPDELLEMEGHCGLIAAWMVLRYFSKRVSVPKLIADCSYTKRHGVFTVGLAAGLKMHGLAVSFHSDPDIHVGGFERRCYAHARRLGIFPKSALSLEGVLHERRCGRIPILFFNTASNVGHFSPLLGVRNGVLRLPLADGKKIPESDFLDRWSEPDILRQCVIVSR